MKILHLTTHINAGGITSYLQTLTKGLVSSGNHVWVLSSGGEREDTFKEAGVKVITMDIKTKSELNPKIYTALGPIKDLIVREGIDVVHAHTRITQVMVALLRRMTERPNVTTCHGFFKTRWNRKLFPCWGVRAIAISEPVRQHLINDFSCREDQVKLIPNGIDLDNFYVATDEQRQQVRAEYGISDQLVVGIIARLSDVKGIDVLINSMPAVCEHYPQVKLLIMGEGKEEAHLKRLVQDLQLTDHVQFVPKIASMAHALNAIDLFVMPSRQEGLGLSVLEAQACGLCVVASKVGGLQSIISDGETGFFVPPEDSPALSHKILELLADEFQRRRVGRQARTWVRDHHGAEKMVNDTITVYQEAC